MSHDIFDKEALNLHFSGDEELIEELLNVFESSYQETFDEMNSALKENDFDKLERAAHTLKGMVSNFFAETIRENAFKIEETARHNSLDNVENLIEVLKKDIPLLVEELKKSYSK
jgi:HPt (histidine-containing phosphotransfer) domain-containing protein